MCYSALVKADYAAYVREYGCDISIEAFHRLYVMVWDVLNAPGTPRPPKVPRAMDAALLRDAKGAVGDALKALILKRQAAAAADAARALEHQRARLADAERKLAQRVSKSASNEARIARQKIAAAQAQLQDLQPRPLRAEDSRIFPGTYCPVMIHLDGRRQVLPMRYQCRPAGVPAEHDRLYPGTYNARRDNLQRYWRGQFGHTHAVVEVDAFFEHVVLDGHHRVLQFAPADGSTMLAACLYAHWIGHDGSQLWSFALITDEPPPEVLAAGHDRCIIPIQASDLDAWLQPDPTELEAQYAILDRRPRVHYRYTVA